MEKKNCKERVMPTLLSAYDDDLKRLGERVGKDRSERTLLSLSQGRKHVASFLKERMKRDDIPLSELMPQMIHDFCAWLSTSRGLKYGTVWLSCQQLKGVVTRAYQRGMLSWNPFSLFHIAKNIRPREYLTESELTLLINHHFEQQQLRFARDIFVFAALTGLAYIDICELRPSDVVTIDGASWIVTRRHKSKVPFQIKLLKTPHAILCRYLKEGHEKIFGQLRYRTLAFQVKKVMKEVGISKHITLHCARHSFAVLALNKGVPIESVSRMLGHTNITTTQIYAKITLQKLDADMTAFERNLLLP
jgi:site-specific recombinase XerD